MEAKPLQVVPSSHNNTSGGGPHKKIDMGQGIQHGGSVVFVVDDDVVGVKEEEEKSKESSSSCVETETYSEEERGKKTVIKACQEHHHRFCFFSVFSEAQRSELDHQVLIFNHLAYNIPIPHNLVLPFLNTCGSNFHKYKQLILSYMSEENHRGFHYGTMVNLEPHRCRRTDGKKWRCSKDVVPNQKYCERHMHRGRNCSRKPVETSKMNSPLITNPCNKLHTMLASKTESSILSPEPLCIQLGNKLSCTPSKSLSISKTSLTSNRLKGIIDSATVVSPGSNTDNAAAPNMTKFRSRPLAASDNRSKLNISRKDDRNKRCISRNISVRNCGKESVTCYSNCVSNGIGFSPRSVLQVSGCNSSYLNDRNSIDLDLEPGRCRRTDGKKWRCKSAVLPAQKYCATHMHRGAKRRFTDHEQVVNNTTSSAAMKTDIQSAHCRIPNTILSISIPESVPLAQHNEKSPCSSSDTDTTITDTMNEYSYASF